MIFDAMLQALPGKTHVQSDGSQIGGVDPAKYSYQTIPGKRQALLLSTEGTTVPGSYPAFMWYPAVPRPILPNTGNLELRMKYMLGGNLSGCNVIETDTILVMNGLKFNGSLQYNQSQGFQVVNAGGEWVNAKISIGPLVANRQYDVRVSYQVGASTISVMRITLDGVRCSVPAALQNLPATPCDWTPGAYLQVQLGSTPSAEPWGLKLKKAEYVWS